MQFFAYSINFHVIAKTRTMSFKDPRVFQVEILKSVGSRVAKIMFKMGGSKLRGK